MVSGSRVDGRERPVIPRSLEAAAKRGASRCVPQRTRTVARASRRAEPAARKAGSARGGPLTARAGKVVGSEVATAQVDGAVRLGTEQRPWGTDPAAIAEARTWLRALGPAVRVVEATGGDEVPLVAERGLAGLPVAVGTPCPVRAFVHAPGHLAQTARL